MKNSVFFTVMAVCLLIQSCAHRVYEGRSLTSIQITDKNGLKQTISHEDRLKGFEKIDFHDPQPYEKVVRSYIDNKSKRDFAKITTYHPNGQIHQSLDIVGGRACGFYHEWYANGHKKVEVIVMEGPGDLSPTSQMNWVFDGVCKAFDKQSNITAEIYYDKGLLTGNSLYFFASGQTRRIMPFENGVAHGKETFFDDKGHIIKEQNYRLGRLHGKSTCQGSASEPSFSQHYEDGSLSEGSYADFSGAITHKVIQSEGYRSIYNLGKKTMVQTIHQGQVEGEITVFDEHGHINNVYHIKKGKKEGAEWVYFPGSHKQPKLYIEWKNDVICGITRSYYVTGTVESEREMVDNKKQGILSAYYEDGSLKMLETYDKNQLVHGKYIRKGELDPISVVENGTGTAMFFDEMGKETLSLTYEKGKVLVDCEK